VATSGHQPAPRLPTALTSARLTLAGLGPVRIGMSPAEVQRAVDTVFAVTYFERCGSVELVEGQLGLVFFGTRLAGIYVTRQSNIATLSGIHIGSSESAVKATYPGRITIEPSPYDAHGHLLVFTPRNRSQGLLIFETDGRVVSSFSAGRAEAVRAREGCA
jgi:hypothetical protein